MTFRKSSPSSSLSPLPARAGVGLKAEHYRDVLEGRPDLGFFEVHTENYFGAGGPPHHYLEKIRSDYALSFHGVGLSLGSNGKLDAGHLARTRDLISRYDPAMVSEHLSWSITDGVYLNDLLPLPMTRETLDLVCDHVDQVQDTLGRQILVENPSTYLRFQIEEYSEPEFLAALAKKTGCGLLLDVNNVYVSAINHGFDPLSYLDGIPAEAVGEYHLAGHHVTQYEGRALLIDDHGSPVCDAVWDLYRETLSRIGSRPSLIEWDTGVPEFHVLEGEAAIADALLKPSETGGADHASAA